MEILGAVAAGEFFGIPAVCLDLVAGLAGDFGWSHDNAVMAELDEAAHQNKAAGTGFIAEMKPDILAVLLAQPCDELVHCVQAVADLALAADFAATAWFGDGNGDGVLVDIKADVE